MCSHVCSTSLMTMARAMTTRPWTLELACLLCLCHEMRAMQHLAPAWPPSSSAGRSSDGFHEAS